MLFILTALDHRNFQQYCIVLQWVKESSRRGDVTAKAAAEWWTGAGSFHSLCRVTIESNQLERLVSRHGSATALRAARQEPSPRCTFCEFPHPAEECWRTRSWTVAERRDRLRRTGDCYWCFQTGHRASDCAAAKPRCTGCGGRHHALVCSRPGQGCCQCRRGDLVCVPWMVTGGGLFKDCIC